MKSPLFPGVLKSHRRNEHDHRANRASSTLIADSGYVRGSPNGKICESTNGTVGTIFTNGNQKTVITKTRNGTRNGTWNGIKNGMEHGTEYEMERNMEWNEIRNGAEYGMEHGTDME